MKKRIISIVMGALLLVTLIPLGLVALADGEEYTAKLEGQMDIDVSELVGEWEIGELPEASTTFTIGEEATISMEFSEPVKFSGNFTCIQTDIAIESSTHAGTTGAIIKSFKVDGNELGSRPVPLVNRDDAGFMALELSRLWGGDYDPYGLVEMDPFSTIEITFVVPNEPTVFEAFLEGQFDTDVNDSFPEWGLIDEDGNKLAATEFEIGEPATISISFDAPVKFTGNWTGLTTNIWVIGLDSAASTNAKILNFIVDGEDLGSIDVPLINRDGGGFLSFDIARQWGEPTQDAYGLIDMEPFSELEITFIVENAPEMIVDEPEEMSDDFATSGNAWIGGTFMTDGGTFDWIPFEDQAVAFELGVPFTVGLDFGSDTQTHGEAEWGYITVVQTDIMDSAINYDAFIYEILVDGRSVNFDPTVIEVGFDGGVRISLTNEWAEIPVVAGINDIGTFSKLEVTMAFVAYGDESPFGDMPVVDEFTPPPSVAPIERPDSVDSGSSNESGGLPGWVIPVIVIAGVAIIVAIVLIVIGNKKKSK